MADLAREAAALACAVPVGPFELPILDLEPWQSPTSAIETRLVDPSARALVLRRVPPHFHADRPIEIELAVGGLHTSAGVSAASSLARRISYHTHLTIAVEATGRSCKNIIVPVSARPSDGGWVVRALVYPASWADSASVTVVSLTVGGISLHCELLPATLRVGYNYAPSPAGAVSSAAQAGDLPLLQAALDSGGSTEEANKVHRGKFGDGRIETRGTF